MSEPPASNTVETISLSDVHPVEPDPGDIVCHLLDGSLADAVFYSPSELVPASAIEQSDTDAPYLVRCTQHVTTRVVNADRGLVQATDDDPVLKTVTEVNELFDISTASTTATVPAVEISSRDHVIDPRTNAQQTLYVFQVLR